MHAKSQSCDRCIRQKGALLGYGEISHKTIKKPAQYLNKKFDDLYKEDKRLRNKKKQKIEQNIRKKQQEQLQDCTFKPNINNNPELFVVKDSFLERQQNWKKALDRKLEQKREQQSKKQINSYTFQPKIHYNLSMTSSQIKHTNNLNYISKHNVNDKRSYKNIHTQSKMLKERTKTRIVDPFKHRRLQKYMENTSSKLLSQSSIEQEITSNNHKAMPEKLNNEETNSKNIQHNTIQAQKYDQQILDSNPNKDENNNENKDSNIQQNTIVTEEKDDQVHQDQIL